MNHAFEKYLNIFRAELPLDECFDLLERKLCIGGRRAVMYFIDGLHDGQKGQLLLNYLLAVQPETMPVSYTHLDVYKRQAIGRFDDLVDELGGRLLQHFQKQLVI